MAPIRKRLSPVENGTLARQVIGRGALGDLPGVLARNVILGPAVIIIGAVACCVVGCIMTIVVAKKTGGRRPSLRSPSSSFDGGASPVKKGEPALVTGNSKI